MRQKKRARSNAPPERSNPRRLPGQTPPKSVMRGPSARIYGRSQRPRDRAPALPSRLLFIDVESSPLLAWSYGPVWQTRLLGVERPSHLLCAAWSWGDERRIRSRSLLDYPKNFKDDPSDDSALLAELHALLTDAALTNSVVCAHNGDRFDTRIIRARMASWRMAPLPPLKTTDTLKMSRKLFHLPSHGLDALCEHFGLGRKHAHDKELWLRVMHGERRALREMVSYCKNDVVLLKELYALFRSWGASHPRMDHGLARPACHVCGSEDVQFRGFSFNGKKRRLACKSCGAWSEVKI
jgi:hypothetical protein